MSDPEGYFKFSKDDAIYYLKPRKDSEKALSKVVGLGTDLCCIFSMKPSEALNLLKWLEQERETLECLAEEEKSVPSVHIYRLDGSCPVQATGIIDDHSAFYFRGRHEQWQFVAGPKELSTDDLVKVQLKMTTDDRVFVLEGDDDERLYQDYDHVRNVLQDYAQQYIEWMNEIKEQHEQEAIEFARDFKSKHPDEEMEEYSRQLSDAIRALRKEHHGQEDQEERAK